MVGILPTENNIKDNVFLVYEIQETDFAIRIFPRHYNSKGRFFYFT